MFDEAVKDFDNFDIIMKMNLLISAKNLCEDLFYDEPILELDCGSVTVKLKILIDFLDREIHGGV